MIGVETSNSGGQEPIVPPRLIVVSEMVFTESLKYEILPNFKRDIGKKPQPNHQNQVYYTSDLWSHHWVLVRVTV